MRSTLRIAACTLALLGSIPGLADDEDCGKNHYILSGPEHCGWVSTGSLHEGRWLHTATLLSDGTVLVAGGRINTADPLASEILGSAEIYQPLTGKWRRANSMNVKRVGHTATLLSDGRVLVAGGEYSEVPQPTLGLHGSVEIFDPSTGLWDVAGSMGTPRVAFSATLLSTGRVLVAGGVDNDDLSLTSCELYDPASGTWSPTGSLAEARYGHTATLLGDGSVLIVGGAQDDFEGLTTKSAELYDTASGKWAATGALRIDRSSHTATLLDDGKVLVTGGWSEHAPAPPSGYYIFQSLAEAELYDPESREWTIAASLPTARFGHTATLLTDGRLLTAGGLMSLGAVPSLTYQGLKDSAIFSKRTAKWGDAGDLRDPREGHTATLLNDGSVLVVGGMQPVWGPRLNSLKSAELFR